MATKTKTFEKLNRLSVVYIRAALNNPQWTTGLDDYIHGCDLLKTLPKLNIPPEAMVTDEAGIKWGSVPCLDKWEIDETDYECVRKALKLAYQNKVVPINEISVALITTFNLKS